MAMPETQGSSSETSIVLEESRRMFVWLASVPVDGFVAVAPSRTAAPPTGAACHRPSLSGVHRAHAASYVVAAFSKRPLPLVHFGAVPHETGEAAVLHAQVMLWRVLALSAAFITGRLTHTGWDLFPTGRPKLQDVAPEERDLLYSPPTGHGVVEVPSIHRDARGEIHNLQIGDARFNVLVTYAGAMRSGDVHRSRQLDLVFSGLCAVTTRERGRNVCRYPNVAPHTSRTLQCHPPTQRQPRAVATCAQVRREYGPGSLIEIPANVPHIFEFINDTVMAEWWPDAAFEARYYKPYRAKVDSANAAMEEASLRRTHRRRGRSGV